MISTSFLEYIEENHHYHINANYYNKCKAKGIVIICGFIFWKSSGEYQLEFCHLSTSFTVFLKSLFMKLLRRQFKLNIIWNVNGKLFVNFYPKFFFNELKLTVECLFFKYLKKFL